jgi:hypothetical protein
VYCQTIRGSSNGHLLAAHADVRRSANDKYASLLADWQIRRWEICGFFPAPSDYSDKNDRNAYRDNSAGNRAAFRPPLLLLLLLVLLLLLLLLFLLLHSLLSRDARFTDITPRGGAYIHAALTEPFPGEIELALTRRSRVTRKTSLERSRSTHSEHRRSRIPMIHLNPLLAIGREELSGTRV